MKRSILLAVSIIVVFAGFFLFFYESEEDIPISIGNKVIGGHVVRTPATDITYDNLANHLSTNVVVKDLPDNTKVLFNFYNFDSGVREVERSFVLTNSEVYEGEVDNPDITMSIASHYLEEWNSRNFCSVMNKARNNGDLGYESDLSSIKLAWKFKSMNKHKSCFGI
jgi:hypothetical protein